VRRSTDRQTLRRNSGGDPREICTRQTPSREARGLSILGASPAREAVAGKATGEQRRERTSRCVSAARRRATQPAAEIVGGP